VRSILTKGRIFGDEYVSQYTVRISIDGANWQYLLSAHGLAVVSINNGSIFRVISISHNALMLFINFLYT
jgi:hypothetical protein